MGLVFRLPLRALRQPENGLCFVVELGCSFNHASRADGALPFLCFAKEKEAKERRPRRAGLAAPNFPHCASFFGACELVALCASLDKRTLFPEKRMLRSAERRGGAGSSKRM